MELNQNQLKTLREICKENNTGKIKYSTALSIVTLKVRRPTITNVEISKLLDMSEVNISRYSPTINKYFKLQEITGKEHNPGLGVISPASDFDEVDK